MAFSLGVQAAWADLIPGSKNNIAGWDIGAYTRDDRFSHCAMSTLYRSGITHGVLGVRRLRGASAGARGWSFSRGQSVPSTFSSISGRSPCVPTRSTTSWLAELPPARAVRPHRRGNRMTVRAAGNNYAFNLDGTYAALTETLGMRGALRRPSPRRRRQSVAHAQPQASPPPPPGAEFARGSTADERLEAKIVANILSRGELRANFRIPDSARSPS